MSTSREEFSSLLYFFPTKIYTFPVWGKEITLSWSTSPTVATYQTWSILAKQFLEKMIEDNT